MTIREIIERDAVNKRLTTFRSIVDPNSIVNKAIIYDPVLESSLQPESLYLIDYDHLPHNIPDDQVYNFLISTNKKDAEIKIDEMSYLKCNILTTAIELEDIYPSLISMFIDDSVVNACIKQMLQARLEKGTKEMLNICAGYIKSDILIMDQTGRALEQAFYHSDEALLDTFHLLYLQENIAPFKEVLPGEMYVDEFLQRVMENRGVEAYFDPVVDKYVIIKHIKVNHISIAKIYAFSDTMHFRIPDIEILGMLSEFMSEDLARNPIYKINYRQKYESFLVRLLEANVTNNEVFEKEKESLGIQFKGLYCVAVISFQAGFPPEEIMRSLETLKAKIMAELPQTFSIIYENSLVVIFNLEKEKRIFAQDNAVLRKLTALDQVVIGISRYSEKLEDIHKLYIQAVRAGKNGLLFKNQMITYYGEITKYVILETLQEQEDLIGLVDDDIMQLYRLSKERQKELLFTLYYYLLYTGNVLEVANKMHVHKNTIFYRLEKIRNMFGSDLEDGETSLRYLFSFEILKYLKLIDFE